MRGFVLVLLIFCSFTSFSQDVAFRYLSTLNGLNNGTINDIAQDNYGNIWFCTWDGAMRYDGYSTVNYKTELGKPNSFPSKHCSDILRDSEGDLWFFARGICRYNRNQDDFISYSLQDINYELAGPGKIFECFEFNQSIYAYTDGRFHYLPLGLKDSMRLFREVEITGSFEIDMGQFLNSVAIDKNVLYLCHSSTDSQGNVTTTVFNSRAGINDPGQFSVNEVLKMNMLVSAICMVNNNRLYLGTTDGLYLFYTSNGMLQRVSGTEGLSVDVLLPGSDQNLWIGTSQSGLGRLNLHTGEFRLFQHDLNSINSLAANVIFSLFEDFSGNLWVGHGGEGLSIINLLRKPFHTFRFDPKDKSSLSSNTVFCFNEADRDVLIGTRNSGLNLMRYNPQKARYIFRHENMPDHFYKSMPYEAIWDIQKESSSVFWLATNFGLIKMERNKGKWVYSQYLSGEADWSDIKRKIFLDENLNLWIGSYRGIYLIPASKRGSMDAYVFRSDDSDPASLSDDVITSFLLDRNGNFWIGTQNGGINLLKTKYYELDLTGQQKPELGFMHFYADGSQDDYLNNNEINCLYEHIDGTIWAGTQGGGINIIDPENYRFSYLTVDDGLHGDDVFSILPDDDGKLWCSTNKGLSCCDPATSTFKNYTPQDGIQGNVFMVNSYFKSSDGKLYFGGRHGITFFEPELIRDNEIAPKLSFTGLDVFNKPVCIGEKINGNILLPEAISERGSIRLTHKENNFSIHFTATHYQSPDENMVEYFLEGYSMDWVRIPASLGYASFSNLPAGAYILKVRASNSDNYWMSEPAELTIEILPPWWETTLARIIILFLVLTFITLIMMLLLHRQALKHSLRLDKIEMEKMNELNESKLQFFTNISHELRTPLSLTVAPIEDLLRKQEATRFHIRNQLILAYRNAKFLLRLINQIIDFRKMNAEKIKLAFTEMDFAQFVEQQVRNFEYLRNKKDIDLHINLPENPFPLWFDPRKMEQVIYNLLSNAFKYTVKCGTIFISVSKTIQEGPDHQLLEEFAQLTVFNEGSFIPEDQLDAIFERFYKIDPSQEGSGIGLALTKSLVELHHGEITAHSTEEGVTFDIFLPVGKDHLTEDELVPDLFYEPDIKYQDIQADKEPVESAAETTSKEGHALSILVVEDSEELREFFKNFLSSEYQYYEAENGRDGYEIAKKIIPDIIISDIVMPEMNGYEFCEKVKSDTTTCHIPVILLTAKDTEESKVYGFNSGADAYVVKPFEIYVLETQIKRLIKNRELIHNKYKLLEFNLNNTSEELSRDDQYIKNIRDLIEENLDDPDLNVEELSRKLAISSTQLYRKIKALTGYSSVEFIRMIRLIRATELLVETQLSVKEVCYKTGFNNQSYFIKCFKEKYGVTPSEYHSSKKMKV